LPPNAEHYLAGGSVCFLARHKTSQLARWQCDKASLDLADKSFKPVTTPSRFKRLVCWIYRESERLAAEAKSAMQIELRTFQLIQSARFISCRLPQPASAKHSISILHENALKSVAQN
jgi:hypothetical protein